MEAQVQSTLTNSEKLYLAFELSQTEWKLGFTTGLGQAPGICNIGAGNLKRLEEEIQKAKHKFELSESSRVISCYEAGRMVFGCIAICISIKLKI